MSDKYPPFVHKLGRVIRDPIEDDKKVTFPISVNRSYDKDDSDWVTVTAWADKKAAAKARVLRKGDRVVVEGNYKETEGRSGGKVFKDILAFAIFRAVEVEDQDDEL